VHACDETRVGACWCPTGPTAADGGPVGRARGWRPGLWTGLFIWGLLASQRPDTVVTYLTVSKLEELQPGLRLAGVIPGQNVAVIAVQPHGADAIELTYKTAEGDLGQRVLGRDAEVKLAVTHAEARPLDAPAADFKLVAE
jgi:hypothetical protein